MKPITALSAAIIAAALLFAGPAAAAFEFQPGQWQETETGEEDGKPVKPEVTTTCMSPEEAKDPVKSLQQMNKDMPPGACKTMDIKTPANGVSIRMQCAQGNDFAMEIDAQFTFVSATHYTGTMKSSVKMGKLSQTQNKKIDAVRIGDCKK